MKILPAVIAVLIVMLVYGCGSSGSSGDKSPLAGTEWVLFEMEGVKYEPASGKNVTMILDGTAKKMGGKAPCNTYGSVYTKSANKISFGNVFSTEMACAELDAESVYYKILPKVFAYQVSGDKLYFFDSGGMVILRFKAK
ncbi:MAG TPA: META domain-containing protein [Ignavibacteria bacterium]|nr:META domain-containing protein [Ignavibacteria bacterium]HMQ97656.1 META domain-containing protein [Ignavibacteria bacterium]